MTAFKITQAFYCENFHNIMVKIQKVLGFEIVNNKVRHVLESEGINILVSMPNQDIALEDKEEEAKTIILNYFKETGINIHYADFLIEY